MPIPLAATEVLDREFLTVREKLLDLAATLDRIDRAEGVVDDDRMEKIRQSLQLLIGDGPDRAQRLQRLFSLPYNEGWQADFGL
ncbi:MAG: hypothetical protein JXB62_12200 [Pirellulales bacterium]|nr:hypothetical protein [Pirellulales bacterium]